MRRLCAAVLVLGVTAVAMPPHLSAAQDLRPYFGVRIGLQGFRDPAIGPALDGNTYQDTYGLSLGVDIGRHLGVELVGDSFDTSLKVPGIGTIAEYGIVAVMPQVRLRLPLLDGRFVPYAVAGVGVSHAEVNDRKPSAAGWSLHGNDWGLAASLGAGAEWFAVSNVAFGLEARYLVLRGHELEVAGNDKSLDLDSFLATATARFYLERPPGAPSGPAGLAGPFYVGARTGGARQIRTRLRPGIDARTTGGGAGRFNQLFGFEIGADLGRYLGVELAADGWEMNLYMPERHATIGEYGIYSVMPSLRARLPLLDDRLVPYAIAGIGVSYAEANDTKPPGIARVVQAEDFAWTAGAGLGVDYRALPNIAFGVQAKYVFDQDHVFRLDGRGARATLDALLLSAGFKFYFGPR